MTKTYKAYISEDGHLTTHDALLSLPTTSQIIINVPDDVAETTAHNETDSKETLADFDQFISDALETDDELTDAEWDELSGIRQRTNAGLSREIAI